jgi:hypothetical protein
MREKRPSPSMVVAIAALVFSLTGMGVASLATISVLSKREKKQTRKIARRIADREVRKLARGLSVATAGTASRAGTAITAGTASTAGTANGLSAPEAWHEVGQPGEPEFQNGWVNYSPKGVETAGFYVDRVGVVHLKGYVTSGTAALIFTLPPAYRPALSKYFASVNASAGATSWIEVYSDGKVVGVQQGGGFGQKSLDGISYRLG